MLLPIEVRIASVEIRDTANTLVACIEILSPVNKREPGLMPYRQKRQRLYNANVHLKLTCCGEQDAPSRNRLSGDGNSQLGAVEVWPILASPFPHQFHCDRPMLMCL